MNAGPIRDLAQLLATLQPLRNPGVFVFVQLASRADLRDCEALALFREAEGWSAILAEDDARRLDLQPLFRAAWISLQVHSDLAAVGLTAAVSQALTAADISCNFVAASRHDHLFVPVNQADRAIDVLQGLQRSAQTVQANSPDRQLSATALLVRDYDEAIAFFVDVLGFELREDSPREAGKRWVRVAAAANADTDLLLARAANAEQSALVGRQCGGRVGFFLQTTDFWHDYRRLQAGQVRFLESPREESYATVVKFEDLYGNPWDLLQYR